jgi:hypothetical protein
MWHEWQMWHKVRRHAPDDHGLHDQLPDELRRTRRHKNCRAVLMRQVGAVAISAAVCQATLAQSQLPLSFSCIRGCPAGGHLAGQYARAPLHLQFALKPGDALPQCPVICCRVASCGRIT